ncbi:hypothetical protein QVD17_36289 [Tagetes erecta]|uniref:Uncharacterized protein n=1 Tax=Tagetes erecta TaxID=13708 RepID=A0AAD8JS32_TARER|nr:hypothetical protein QVD17_36289 [Tagetes erecta]
MSFDIGFDFCNEESNLSCDEPSKTGVQSRLIRRRITQQTKGDDLPVIKVCVSLGRVGTLYHGPKDIH